MEILHSQNARGGRFYISEPDDTVTELEYKIAEDGRMVIEHTEVSPHHEGKGIGHLLVDRAVEYARENRRKILPTCRFAKAVLERSDEYKDVLATRN